MGRPRKAEQAWYEKAAELMVRHGMSLRQAASEIGVPLTTEEAEAIGRRQGFQRVLWLARNRYYQEVASDPGRTKNAALGLLYVLAQKLIEGGEFDKAADVIFKMLRAEGHVGPEQQVSVIAGLSANELEAVRKKLEGYGRESDRPSTERVDPARVN